MKKAKDLIYRSLKYVSLLFPVRKKLWVFGCWSGKLYADNAKYLFEYIHEHDKTVTCLWITRSEEIRDMLTRRGYRCCRRSSLRGILAALTAEAAFMTANHMDDISPFVNAKKTKVFQLWHGIGAKAMKWEKLDPREVERFNQYTWLATSPAYIDILHDATRADKEKFVITGYPRNDVFVRQPENEVVKQILSEHPAEKYILYMPTHRNFGREQVKVDEFLQIDRVFREQGILMGYKPHFHELKNILHLESRFTNIIVAKDQEVWGDAYSYIGCFDLLIGDYSSISYDFLCAKNPIVQYVYDLEHYKQADFGLCDFFEEQPLGPFCYTWEETVGEVLALLEKDTWYEQREKCRKQYHSFEDGNNSARVYAAAMEICGGLR